MFIVGQVLYWLLQIYIFILLARMIISWIPVVAPNWRPGRFFASIFEIIYTVTDPPIDFAQRIIPPLRVGRGVSLDLGFMLVFALCVLAQWGVVSFMF